MKSEKQAKDKNQNQENHLSSKFDDVLLYQQRLHKLQYDAGRIRISPEIFLQQIQKDFKPETIQLASSKLPLQKIYERVGLAICYNPFFIKDLIFKYYLPFIPKEFKGQLDSLMNIAVGFDVAWWSALAGALIFSWKKRNAKISTKQQITRNLFGIAFLLGSQYLFRQGYFTPTLQKSFYKNIRYVDKIVQKHISMIQIVKQNMQTQNPKSD